MAIAFRLTLHETVFVNWRIKVKVDAHRKS